MGRKIKSTKSGKFINPTDLARKEARKRELRKNKRQRLLVRTAVLKGKDPYQIIADLERLDKMEFDFVNLPALNEKVLKDKRRKLHETWDRLCRLYVKEDRERYNELKRMEAEYDMKRNELKKQYDAIKSAQEVSLDEIPLPALPIESTETSDTAGTIDSKQPTESILKSVSGSSISRHKRLPPGCPHGLPPTLSEFEDSSNEDSEDEEIEHERTTEANSARKHVKFGPDITADKPTDKDNLTEFLKEIEQIAGDSGASDVKEGKTNEQPAVEEAISDKQNATTYMDTISSSVVPEVSTSVTTTASSTLPMPSNIANPFYSSHQIHSVPPVIVGSGKPLVGGPPSLSIPRPPPPPGSSFGPSRLQPPSLLPPGHLDRLPMPPTRSGPPLGPMPPPPPTGSSASSLLLPSYLMPNYTTAAARRNNTSVDSKSGVTTIEAKPQLRNLSADATKFMPLSLRVKRDENKQSSTLKTRTSSNIKTPSYGLISSSSSASSISLSSAQGSNNNNNNATKSTDNAYEQFMKEMQGLM